jgi:NAD(P)H-flavin reductase
MISYRTQSYEKGNISRHVSLLKIGDKIRVKGPKAQFNYSSKLSREIGMIAGGTGITPMLQIIRAALKNPEDPTRLNLVYANVNHNRLTARAHHTKAIDRSMQCTTRHRARTQTQLRAHAQNTTTRMHAHKTTTRAHIRAEQTTCSTTMRRRISCTGSIVVIVTIV